MFSFLKKQRFCRPISTTKLFHAALDDVNANLASGKNFSLARFGDGEMAVINGEAIDLLEKWHGEHQYIPGSSQHETQRARLTASLLHQSKNYFVGIACPCCVGEQAFLKLKQQSQQRESQLTWANVFVNSNFPRFQALTTPLLAKRKTVLISHIKSQPTGLPFLIERHFGVGPNAWLRDHDRLLGELTNFIEQYTVHDHVFLFCAGVLSNILIFELHQRFPQNTYLDVGSVFDVELGLGATRKYLMNKRRRLRKICVWI
jgi:hypothetical protein